MLSAVSSDRYIAKAFLNHIQQKFSAIAGKKVKWDIAG